MGSFSILNNIAGLNAQSQLNINNINLTRTLLRLSSGKRINSGADDAAGLQIADSLRANVRALDQAVRNANDGISVAQIADGALQEISNILTRAVTLAEEAATATVDSTGPRIDQCRVHSDPGRNRAHRHPDQLQRRRHLHDRGVNGSLSVFVGDISTRQLHRRHHRHHHHQRGYRYRSRRPGPVRPST